MLKKIGLALIGLLFSSGVAAAATCASFTYTLQNGQTADANQVMTNFNTVRNCVVNNAAASGANSDITSLNALSTPISPSQGGSPVFVGGATTNVANAYVLAATTPVFTLTPNYIVAFIANATNTGDSTINVNATGAVHIKKKTPTGLALLTGGELRANSFYMLIYDGTVFQLDACMVASTSTTTNDVLIFSDASGCNVKDSGVAFPTAHTRQVFLSGAAQTYTTPAGVTQLMVREVGGGGGGGASTTNTGTTGSDTLFNAIHAAGGSGGGPAAGAAGAGGVSGSGAASLRVAGAPGGACGNQATSSAASGGGNGGGLGNTNTATGANGAANTGGGGAGGSTAGGGYGCGGGAGEYVELLINSPASTYTYTVGGGGNGGAAGGEAGGNGGSGYIVVDEYYY